MAKIRQFIGVVADSYNSLVIYKLLGDELEQDFLKKNAAITQTPTATIITGDSLPILESSKAVNAPRKINWGPVVVTAGHITSIGNLPIMGKPSAPDKSIQFNKSGDFGGSAGLTYNHLTDELILSASATSTVALLFTTDPSGPIITSSSTGNTFSIGNYVVGSVFNHYFEYEHIWVNKLGIGTQAVDSDTYMQVSDMNLPSTKTYTYKIKDSSNRTTLGVANTGDFYLPRIASATSSNVLYFNSSTGLVTYGSSSGQSEMSITGDGSTGSKFKLVGDNASPGVSKYYGTDIAGIKGYHDVPTASASSWIGLSDTLPESFVGKAFYVPMVIAEETAIDLVESEEIQTVVATLLLLADFPQTYTNHKGQLLKVKDSVNGVEFIVSLPIYADNTAALAALLTPGEIYMLSDGTIKIVY